jgi:hypothetical protein
MTNEIS